MSEALIISWLRFRKHTQPLCLSLSCICFFVSISFLHLHKRAEKISPLKSVLKFYCLGFRDKIQKTRTNFVRVYSWNLLPVAEWLKGSNLWRYRCFNAGSGHKTVVLVLLQCLHWAFYLQQQLSVSQCVVRTNGHSSQREVSEKQGR